METRNNDRRPNMSESFPYRGTVTVDVTRYASATHA